MGRGRWYVVAVLGLLVVAAVVAWRTWPVAAAGPYDPVAAVIALAALAVGVASLRHSAQAQQLPDADVGDVARRLAVAVRQVESEACWQLLGGHDRPIDVQFSFRPALAHDAAGAGPAGRLDEVAAYYRQLRPQRMVITGAAGSGKTVLVLRLILSLLDGRAEDAPVPVRIPAAQLDTNRPPNAAVPEWLAGHLRQAYQLSQAAARQVVAARMVLPVIDGLDEMDAAGEPGYASRAGQVIRACNAYLDGGQKASVVLTCRIGQYRALEQAREWVHDAARVELHPVALPEARSFLSSRAADMDRWRPVLEAMERPEGAPLARALSTPWRLTLAAVVYGQRDPATGGYLRDPIDLASADLDTEDKVRDHLLGLFIPAAVTLHGGRHSPARVHRWLGVLARYLDANASSGTRPGRVIAGRALSGTDLVLHEMWPLAGARLPRAVIAGLVAAIVLAMIVSLFILPVSSLGPMHAQGSGVNYLWNTIGLAALGIIFVVVTWIAWPPLLVPSIRQLRSSHGRREFTSELVAGPVAMVGFVLVAWLAGWLRAGTRLVAALGLGLVAGLGLGLVSGLVKGLLAGPHDYSGTKPGDVLRATLRTGLAAGLWPGLLIGLTFGPALGARIVFGLGFGLGPGLIAGLVAMRYVALLSLTRRWSGHWLPWRLGSFLQWCYRAGLLRVAGIGYQFRHRELQDYLAWNPIA